MNYFLRPTESASLINERNQKQEFEFAKRKNRFSNEFFIGENQKWNKYFRGSPKQKEYPNYWVDKL